MTPLLISVFKLNPAVAIGTDLWFAAITKSGGAWAHQRHGHVDYRITGLMLAGSIPAALATIGLMHFTGVTKGWAQALTFSLGIALLVTAVVVAYRQAWQALGLKLERWLPARRKAGFTVAAGLLLGVLVSLSSIGAGALGATLILLLYPRLPAHRLCYTPPGGRNPPPPPWAMWNGGCWPPCWWAACPASGWVRSSPSPCPSGWCAACCVCRW
jgi:uncharacterized protein